MSRKQLADLTEIHPQTIGYIERQQFNPTIELALKLSKTLGVGLDAIRKDKPVSVNKGSHGLSNHLLDTDWPKVRTGRARLDTALSHGSCHWRKGFEFCLHY